MTEQAPVAVDRFDRLTRRQLEVLRLIAEGLSNRAIAARLAVSEKAVVRHTSNIYDLLGLASSPDDHRRVLAVQLYLAAVHDAPVPATAPATEPARPVPSRPREVVS